MFRRAAAVLALVALAPSCARSCNDIGYRDALTMSAALVPIADVVSVCIDERCYRAPFDGSVTPDLPTLDRSGTGSMVLGLRAGRLPNRAGTVRVVLVGGRVLEGRAETPSFRQSPAGKGCGPDQRTQAVALS